MLNIFIYLEKQVKIIEDEGRKQVQTLKVLKPKTQQLPIKKEFAEDQLSEEVKNEIENIKKIEKMVSREKLIYKAGNFYIKFSAI